MPGDLPRSKCNATGCVKQDTKGSSVTSKSPNSPFSAGKNLPPALLDSLFRPHFEIFVRTGLQKVDFSRPFRFLARLGIDIDPIEAGVVLPDPQHPAIP